MFYSFSSFSHQRKSVVSHWSFSDSKFPQFSGTHLSILADLNNAVVGVATSYPLIFKFSSLFINRLTTVTRAPITIGITITFMFYSFFFNSPARSRYLSFRFLSILLCGRAAQQIPQFGKFFFSCWLLLGLVVLSKLSNPFVSQNTKGVYVCHSPGQIVRCLYTICLYRQISISCQIPCWSPCPIRRIPFLC